MEKFVFRNMQIFKQQIFVQDVHNLRTRELAQHSVRVVTKASAAPPPLM